MSAQKDNVFSAYDNAIGFANAFHLLFSKTNINALMQSRSAKDASMVMPTIVNGTLACELFLKALLKEPPCKGKDAHSLVSLLDQYNSEQPGKKDYIMQACIQAMQLSQSNNKYNKDAFQRDLQAIDTAFLSVRYWHEPKKQQYEQTYSLGFLVVFVGVLQQECNEIYGNSVFLQ